MAKKLAPVHPGEIPREEFETATDKIAPQIKKIEAHTRMVS